ncbi:beta-galactosidase [Paenibacillus daejeonensis]|uniref:beta-galactosidase n=1 Tax=Paenibacillus daejeonensis TaxID=135193 RepID=UPI00037A332C|nr:beta-galactosidase [Paenibacillus daejeonensis]
MTPYSLHIDQPNKEIRPGKLAGNGGSSPKGGSYGFTNFYMLRNGKPFIPVVGEFHFARFSYLHWEEELLKMKAGGVNIVATYIFWNYHEEEEGVFNWHGNRNLRHFVDLCAKHELPLVLRIGPFCHGEVRNGGIPDWVFHKPLDIRSNDPHYLAYAKRLYRQIARQVKGSLFQEGGPVIAVQLENEYMHCGAPQDSWGYKTGVFMSSGTGGEAHLDELRRIAEGEGIRPIFFTATAWGGAAVSSQDTLPMLAGYAYTPWIPNQPPSGEYIFRDLHVTPMEAVNYDSEQVPVAYCEMAGGMQVSYTARPNVSPESVEAMTLVKLASGSNLLGYYMYHGGSNPEGQRGGYLNEYGLPKITYDYQSPLGEFGRVGKSYDRIRSLALFMEAYGELLAPMGTLLPQGQETIDPEDMDSLRWCVRHKDGGGFVFLNNFQDHQEMPERSGVRLELETAQGAVAFPQEGTFTLSRDVSAVLPFHLDLYGAHLISATVQPLTRLEQNDPTLVFYVQPGLAPELVWDRSTVAAIHSDSADVTATEQRWVIKPAIGKQHGLVLELTNGQEIHVIVLSRQEALQTYKVEVWGQERLVISSSRIYVKDERLISTSEGASLWQVSLWPGLPEERVQTSTGTVSHGTEGVFQTLELQVADYAPEVKVEHPMERSALLTIDTEWPQQVSDVFLHVAYDGDVAAAYLGDRMLTDHIHYGESWPIGLKQFREELEGQQLHLSITPLRKGTVHTFVNQALVERFEGVEIAVFHEIKPVPYYTAALYQSYR